MTLDQKTLDDMQDVRNKTSSFIQEISTPIKKEYIEELRKYINSFIAFPGALSVISIFFASSNFVRNHTVALIGVALIISSLLVALNVLRKSTNIGYGFYERIVKIEQPMLLFGHRLTQFSRKETTGDHLIESYNLLQESYKENTLGYDENKSLAGGLKYAKDSINVSFWILVTGILLCFLSTLVC